MNIFWLSKSQIAMWATVQNRFYSEIISTKLMFNIIYHLYTTTHIIIY